jgi:hypothetical protein
VAGRIATYRYHPYDDPVVGRHAVVAPWLDESDAPGVSASDAPGPYDGTYAAIAVDGDLAVAPVSPRSARRPATVDRLIHNCFDSAMRRTEPHRVVHGRRAGDDGTSECCSVTVPSGACRASSTRAHFTRLLVAPRGFRPTAAG